MARRARLVVPDIVHHVVARGVNKTRIFRTRADKEQYLLRAARIATEERVLVHGYCLMPNHVHFLLTPTTPNGLARFFSRLHTWWAGTFNRQQGRTGHLFQSRYFSSPLSETHYWTALRYVELNAVRARLARHPEEWPWSSARDHLKLRPQPPVPLAPVITRATCDPLAWRAILQTPADEADDQLRRAHRSSRPCGPPAFLARLQQHFRPSSRTAPVTTAA